MSDAHEISSKVLLESALNFVREHHLLSVGIGFGAGCLLGYTKGREVLKGAADAAAGFALREAVDIIQNKLST